MDFQKIHENAEGEVGRGGEGFYLITVSIRYSFHRTRRLLNFVSFPSAFGTMEKVQKFFFNTRTRNFLLKISK